MARDGMAMKLVMTKGEGKGNHLFWFRVHKQRVRGNRVPVKISNLPTSTADHQVNPQCS